MAFPKNVSSWRLALVGLLAGLVLAGAALALLAAAPDADPAEGADAGTPYDHDEPPMDADERCAHMPEHCTPPTRRETRP